MKQVECKIFGIWLIASLCTEQWNLLQSPYEIRGAKYVICVCYARQNNVFFTAGSWENNIIFGKHDRSKKDFQVNNDLKVR